MVVKVREVARRLSLSPATVSKVVRGRTGDVSTATAQRVLEHCQRSGYMTEAEAGHIFFRIKTRTSKKQIFAVTLSGGIEAYDASFAGICQQMQHNEMFASLYVIGNKEAIKRFPFEMTGAAMIIGPSASSLVQDFRKRDIPVVLLDNRLPQISSVNSDNLEGTSESVELLFRLGHRRMAFVCTHQCKPALNYTFRQRENGYISGMSKVDLPFDRDLLILDYFKPYLKWDDPSERERFTSDLQGLAKRLLGLKEVPTANVRADD